MKELYKILYISGQFDCFFHLNEKGLRQFSSQGSPDDNCIKIEFGRDLSRTAYSSINTQPNTQIEDGFIGICYNFAQTLSLKEGDEVFISKKCAKALSSVKVLTNNQHYQLIMKNHNLLENIILNQIRIVAKGQIISIQTVSNTFVLLKVVSLEPEISYGKLENSTQLDLTAVSNVQENDFDKPQTLGESDDGDDDDNMLENACCKKIDTNFDTLKCDPDGTDVYVNQPSGNAVKNYLGEIMNLFTQVWKTKEQADLVDKEDENVQVAPPHNNNNKESFLYRVSPSLVIENEFPKILRDNFAIVRRLPLAKEVDGPCCFKLLCKVSKVEKSKPDLIRGSMHYYTFAYVISFSDDEDESNDNVYCPDYLYKELNLKVGSFMEIEEVRKKKEFVQATRRFTSFKKSAKDVSCNTFTEGMKKIYESSIKTVINNLRYNQSINTLIVGGTGTGKSFILDSLKDYFAENNIFCNKLDCKRLRKTKISSLLKMLSTTLSECCENQPSVLLIDDLDSLVIAEEEENQYKTIYSERVGNLLRTSLCSHQKFNCINIVASISSLSKFKYVSTERGPIMFENICGIGELDSAERSQMIHLLISKRFSKSSNSFIPYVTEKTKGYNIQDLTDLIEIAAFKCKCRNKYDEVCNLEIEDFESALSEKIPLSLYGVNLSKSLRSDWDDVGGLEGPKKLLREMFEWPLKYRQLYKSCPLRLQCGVLLYGAPGTGKTLLASAVARECGLNFISVKGPEIFSKYVGASEQGVRDLFLRARRAKPCLLFFDEFDSLAPRRGSSNEDVNDRVVNQLLTELDGVEELVDVFILGATSRPDLLDPALLRPGRIDKAVHCTLPEQEERLSILKALSKPLHFADDVNLEEIASRTDGYTGADLKAILYSAQTALIKEIGKEFIGGNGGELVLRRSHLLVGLADTKPSITKEDKLKYKTIYDQFISSRMGRTFQRSQEALQKTMFA